MKTKKVTVVGLGKSGLAAAKFLCQLGATVRVTDCRDDAAVRDASSKLPVEVKEVELGKHSERLIKGADFVITSPGVSPDSLPLVIARQKGIPIFSELELGFQYCSAPVIAVTGTNGKSTTVSLIGALLRAQGRKVVIAGNIGLPLTAVLEEVRDDYLVVLEVSSYQLETVVFFKPFIAVLLNIVSDHLERYSYLLDDYICAKMRLFSNQQLTDYLVFNRDDPLVVTAVSNATARTIPFSRRQGLSCGVFLSEGMIKFCFQGNEVPLCDIQRIKLTGVHNHENVLAAVAVTGLCGQFTEEVIDTLRQFEGLEHRTEFVAEVDGVKFINDSKATNVGACQKALESYSPAIILIAGGRSKGDDYSVLSELIEEKVKEVILFGEAGERMAATFSSVTRVVLVDSLPAAVRTAYRDGVRGDLVLFSPACSSFDMFANFEERGCVFKKAVQALGRR